MAEVARRLAGLSPAKRRLLEQRLKSRPEAAEPVAIVGMSCRFPGAPDISSFWRVIEEGIDATGEIPESRWAVDQFYDPTGEQSGKMSTRWAGLIDGPDQFDPMFFGITPREANFMDPPAKVVAGGGVGSDGVRLFGSRKNGRFVDRRVYWHRGYRLLENTFSIQ